MAFSPHKQEHGHICIKGVCVEPAETTVTPYRWPLVRAQALANLNFLNRVRGTRRYPDAFIRQAHVEIDSPRRTLADLTPFIFNQLYSEQGRRAAFPQPHRNDICCYILWETSEIALRGTLRWEPAPSRTISMRWKFFPARDNKIYELPFGYPTQEIELLYQARSNQIYELPWPVPTQPIYWQYQPRSNQIYELPWPIDTNEMRWQYQPRSNQIYEIDWQWDTHRFTWNYTARATAGEIDWQWPSNRITWRYTARDNETALPWQYPSNELRWRYVARENAAALPWQYPSSIMRWRYVARETDAGQLFWQYDNNNIRMRYQARETDAGEILWEDGGNNIRMGYIARENAGEIRWQIAGLNSWLEWRTAWLSFFTWQTAFQDEREGVVLYNGDSPSYTDIGSSSEFMIY